MLITFEGIDGSGKSTQIGLLKARLRKSGRKVLCLREPGGTVVSERIRELLLDPDVHIDPVAEMLLFSAARAQIVSERVLPALERGETVILDRFYDSTTAYQGAGRQVADVHWIQSLHSLATRELTPDRTYWIDVDPEIARRRQDGQERDRIELGDRDFYRRIHDCYAELAEAEPDRFLRIDGTLPVDEIERIIWDDFQLLRS